MKTITFLLLFVTLVVAENTFTREEAIKAFKSESKTCVSDTQASDDDVEAILLNLSTITDAGKCLRHCLMRKYNMITSDGKLSVGNMVHLAGVVSKGNSEKMRNAQEIGDKCAKIRRSNRNECEIAYAYDQCIRDEIASRRLNDGY